MDRPDRRNAFDDEMIDEFVERVGGISSATTRCAIITGKGSSAFCAGYDVSCIDPDQPDDTPLPDQRFERVIDALQSLPFPVVCALNGNAFGGGFDMAIACDYIVASRDSSLAMTPCRLGLVYSHTGISRFAKRIGSRLTRRLFLSASPISAEEAHRLGIVDELADPADLMDAASRIAGEISANAPLAVKGTRATILAYEQDRLHMRETLGELKELRMDALRSGDLKEALAAFEEKRNPNFNGK